MTGSPEPNWTSENLPFLSIPFHWTILHEVIGATTLMALQDLAVSTSRVPPPTSAFARGPPTA
eukprot:814091-Pyramimonas_sp.AAC.1